MGSDIETSPKTTEREQNKMTNELPRHIWKCVDCGKLVDYRAIRCRVCYDKSRENWVTCKQCLKSFKADACSDRQYCSRECDHLAKIGKHSNENNHMWKGNKVGYNAIHVWVRKYKPKPKFCEICNLNEPKEVALIKGKEHGRDINLYQWLCLQCHRKKDLIECTKEAWKAGKYDLAHSRLRGSNGRFITTEN